MPCSVIECAWEGVFSLNFIHREPRYDSGLRLHWLHIVGSLSPAQLGRCCENIPEHIHARALQRELGKCETLLCSILVPHVHSCSFSDLLVKCGPFKDSQQDLSQLPALQQQPALQEIKLCAVCSISHSQPVLTGSIQEGDLAGDQEAQTWNGHRAVLCKSWERKVSSVP